MLLLNPIWLWALAGLAIPIGIHLLSRKEGQIIRIGSLRHLQETNTQQFKGIRLNEIVLLALRCLLIVLFVLIMSGLSFEHERAANIKWVLIEKGLERLSEVQTQLDTFQSSGYEVRWLSSGFPMYDDSSSVMADNLYWGLVEQLQNESVDDVVVISKNDVNAFKGKRPQLPANMRWISVPAMPHEFTLKANALRDSVIVRKGISEPDKTHFTTEIVSRLDWHQSTLVQELDTIEVVIAWDNRHQYDKEIVEASLQALRSIYLIHIKVTQTLPDKISSVGYGDWCIWLADQPIPASTTSSILYQKSEANQEIIVQDKPNRWRITKILNEEIALNESFTVKLAGLLLSSEKDWQATSANDRRMLVDESAWSTGDSDKTEKAPMIIQSADSYLLVLFLFALLVERLVAYYRNQ